MTVESKTKQAATAPAPAPEASTEQPDTVDTTKLAADAAQAEQARIAGILQCEESEGRTKLAQHLAFNTKMSVEDAKAALAAADEAPKAANNSLLDAAMGNTKQPKIGADNGSADGDPEKPDPSVALISDYRKFTGRAAK